ncbi:MAG TPA: S9 family peptidase [Holophagaceae bacterium]|nr:S9 family peptidase [Holophagaceae bacterium]
MRHPLLALLACFSLAAQAPPQGWTPEAMLQVKRLESPRPSPDGNWVAFTVRSALMGPDQSEFRTQIHLAATTGASRRALTLGDKSSLDPKWSPDGRSLAFRSPRSGRMQLYVLRMDGGEAEMITNGKGEVTAFAWSPEGRRFAFTMMDGRTEEEEKREKAKDDARWFEEQPKVARLYVVDLAPDASGNRTPRLLTPEARHVQSFDWSPDGATLAYAHTRSAKADHWPTSDLALVKVEGGQERVLAATPAAEGAPKFSRDGKTLAFTLSDPKPRWAGSHRLALLDVASGAIKPLPPTPDGQPQLLGWSGDGRHLIFLEATAVKGGIYSMRVDDGSLLRLDAGAWTVASGAMVGAGDFVELDPTGRYLGLVVQTASEPPTLAFSTLSQFSPKVIARPNGDLPRHPLPRTEVVRWKGAQGKEIEGLLTYPIDGKPAAKAPLIVTPHGGPTQMYGETYVASPSQYPLAALAARGFAILRPNIRGSSGYGRDFRFANEADWGGLDFQDLMAGVDHVIALGVADPERLGIAGWSYGGFMTSWTITQTRRFKAASVGAGVTNLMSFNGTSDIPSFIPDYFGGDSWEQLERYRAHSALFQVKGVTTPTLIQHCEGDQRVPIGQGYELHNALTRQGVECRMQVVPRQAHGPTEPRALQRLAEANLEWFTRWFK